MRFFVEIAYNGTRYHGWQKQPNAKTLQEEIENVCSILLKNRIEIMGCGRTDTGVHSSQYFFHFDFDGEIPANFIQKLNTILSNDIAVKRVFPVKEELHARFSALNRAYQYHISFEKQPFHLESKWYYPVGKELDVEKLQEAAKILLSYKDFKPFCKSNSGLKQFGCDLTKSYWEVLDNGLVYHVEASRFLRGMVRIIVGTCISIANGKMSKEQLIYALDNQTPLPLSWSIPPQGLFLSKIEYNF